MKADLILFNVSKISVDSKSAHRNNHDVVLQEDLVCIWGGGSIGSLSNDLTETKVHL